MHIDSQVEAVWSKNGSIWMLMESIAFKTS